LEFFVFFRRKRRERERREREEVEREREREGESRLDKMSSLTFFNSFFRFLSRSLSLSLSLWQLPFCVCTPPKAKGPGLVPEASLATPSAATGTTKGEKSESADAIATSIKLATSIGLGALARIAASMPSLWHVLLFRRGAEPVKRKLDKNLRIR